MSRGYFAVGIYGCKTKANIGTLWRSASLYGAAFVYTVGVRYQHRQASDTMNTALHVPLFHFTDMADLTAHLPSAVPLVGVELDPRAVPLPDYHHRERAAYLLGAEDDGLPQDVIDGCDDLVAIPSVLPWSMNVATAGAVLLYDRHVNQLVRQRVTR